MVYITVSTCCCIAELSHMAPGELSRKAGECSPSFAQEEGNSMVHTHPGLTPFPCNHLGGYCKGSEQAVVSWAGRVATERERYECLGRI